jgi:hypothetical protein
MIYVGFNSVIFVSNTSFNNIICSSATAVVYNTKTSYVHYNGDFINCNFTNITSTGEGTEGLCINFGISNGSINNCCFTNISGSNGYSGGAIRVTNGSFIDGSIQILSSNFTNITVKNNGGALYDSCGRKYSITSSVFEKCSSISGAGGAIYLNSTVVPTYVSCRFIENVAFTGGNDIAHSFNNPYSSYSSATINNTCSSSDSPQTSFPNGSNVDNFFTGLKNDVFFEVFFF